MKIALIAVQGDVSEHKQAIEVAGGEVVLVKRRGFLSDCEGIVIPGGESTTFMRLLRRAGIDRELVEAKDAGKAIFGTCAGLVVIGRSEYGLGLIDAEVERNVFGTQRESFEAMLKIPVLGEEPFRAIFIRAPVIKEAGEGVEVLARIDRGIVLAKQGKILVSAFHPELLGDSRLFEYFLRMVEDA
jgi:5'-phosphate synthase pdxT subunit